MVDLSASTDLELDNDLLFSQQSPPDSSFFLDGPLSPQGRQLLSPADGLTSPPPLGICEVFSSERQDVESADSDIYRGERQQSIQRPLGDDEVSVAPSSSSFSSSSSSSSSLNVGRRLGALAGVVESAITRWARAHSSASSTTSSSSSASSTTHWHTARRRKGRRYSTSASVLNAAHERAFLALKRAHEEFRVVPREFTLLLPSDTVLDEASLPDIVGEQEKESRVTRTGSLPLILSQLDSALKKSAKSKRAANKGKGKSTVVNQTTPWTSKAPKRNAAPKCWWLDVASPSWDDLRSIGKLLHIHPLTLEDILHRDPREKLELFPKLGYYFIVFRALEGERSRERFRQFRMQSSDGIDSLPSTSADEGVVGAVNVYIIVLAEGICSFHFEDISEHTEKLRSRILQLQHRYDMSSDWIAHGLMDSIVDSFFPILSTIDKEIKEIDTLILKGSNHKTAPISDGESVPAPESDTGSSTEVNDEKGSSDQVEALTKEKSLDKEKGASMNRLDVGVLRLSSWSQLKRLKWKLRKIWKRRGAAKYIENEESMTTTLKTLLKIAAIRRIVTSLTRLLGTKGDVVSQIRKRLILASADVSKSGLGLDTPFDGEIAIYMGDVQDHIATLQQSLIHYERMLSHSHPTYLSSLRVTQGLVKGDTDKAILILTVVSIAVVSIQVLLGMFSMNVNVPVNDEGSEHPYSIFFSIMGASLLNGACVIGLVRYWQVRAKKKWSRKI